VRKRLASIPTQPNRYKTALNLLTLGLLFSASASVIHLHDRKMEYAKIHINCHSLTKGFVISPANIKTAAGKNLYKFDMFLFSVISVIIEILI